ncbi:DUF1343 domain-containing protein [Ilyomonas limi]|uniref:DUF1343 domain-containing protein n=1 Tax=Ilyomonas limi TaxID=2575867 RepID=A0A4U3KXY8_9BACT|nr:DUF1343 domain-containing protein [Ilyomonas limi]TKK65987.1 DUF1343 domain-containing protein [Ilyomonas limi]
MIYKRLLLLLLSSVLLTTAFCQTATKADTAILPGAYRTDVYLPYLTGKKVGIFANQTSTIGQTHLVDTLQKLGVNIVKIFAPEHGFRGTAGAGEHLNNDTDKQTGIPIVSLYGKKVKPTTADLKDVDVLVFDLQDVGVRFYTYLSSLQYFMEGAFENGKPLFVLDRPNPNGFYVDGPVLEPAYKSFIGMQPIPVVYGMTIGEYARMIAGEKWLSETANKVYTSYEHAKATKDTPIHFIVIKCANYTHASRYQLPVAPSPNLPTMHAVYMYPSTCFFEGTNLSEGRGTAHPFEYFGHPSLPDNLFHFTPQSTTAAKDPKLKNQLCYGWDITDAALLPQLQLKWLLQAYQLFPDKDSFFIQPKSKQPADYFFNKLTGNSTLMQQIISGKTEAQIRASWQPQLDAFKKIRKKYLLYEDER